jgi:hypothetical protein
MASTQVSASTDRLASPRIDRAAPSGDSGPTIGGFGSHRRALAIIIIAVVALAVLPELVNYLYVSHFIQTVGGLPPPLGATVPRVPIARVVRWVASAVVFLVSAVILLMRGHPDRNVSGAFILLFALAFPYLVNFAWPGRIEIILLVMGVAVVLAVWNIGAPIDGLKWVPVTASLVAVYSIIGGLIAPEYMMNRMDRDKAVIGNWELAGAFSHGNFLGAYCALALALIPLITSIRWRILNGLVLCAAIVLTASRTAQIVAGVVVLWWIICRLRSVISVRLAGTALIGFCATIVVVLPLLSWTPKTFSGRALIWATSLSAWQDSRLVSRLLGLGADWFKITLLPTSIGSWQYTTWVYMYAGHNLFINTLITSGLAGIFVLGLVFLAAIRVTRGFKVLSYQIACFGYLIAFLVESITEAMWTLQPAVNMFPVVGLVFAVIILARCDAPACRQNTRQLPERFDVSSQVKSFAFAQSHAVRRTQQCGSDNPWISTSTAPPRRPDAGHRAP